MSFWSRLQKSFSRNQNSVKAENLAAGILEAVISIGLLWGLQKLNPRPLIEEKTFKELHQPRSPSHIRNDDTPEEFQ